MRERVRGERRVALRQQGLEQLGLFKTISINPTTNGFPFIFSNTHIHNLFLPSLILNPLNSCFDLRLVTDIVTTQRRVCHGALDGLQVIV